jgi:hypothetical protein
MVTAKNAILLLILLLPGYLQSQVTFHPGDLNFIVKAEKKAHAGKLLPRGHSASQGYDVKYYRCFWNIDPAINYISGNITTYFTPTQSAFDSMEFNLNNALTVDSVIYHHTFIPFVHASDILTIKFPFVLPKG